MKTQLVAGFILILGLSLCHLHSCASYKRRGQPKSTDHRKPANLVRVALLRSEELDSFEALSRSHDIFKGDGIKERKPVCLNSQLVGSVGIGSPVQEFRLIFDTTYANMWIPSLNCTNCGNKKRYDSSASTTYIKDGEPIYISWDKGFRSTDQVSFGDIVIKNQTFAEMTTVVYYAENAPYDGLFCLAFDIDAQQDVVTPLRNMLDQKLISREMFSIYQNSTGGEIVFGGYDRNHFEGFISWQPNADLVNWSFRMDSITLKKSSISEEVRVCADGCKVRIYTYRPYILGPPEEVMLINEAIGAELDEDDDTMFVLPDCDLSELPNLVFKIGYHNHEFTPDLYIQKVKKGDKTICVSSLHAVVALYPTEWYIGSSFVGHIYTVFDYENRALGFAHAK